MIKQTQRPKDTDTPLADLTLPACVCVRQSMQLCYVYDLYVIRHLEACYRPLQIKSGVQPSRVYRLWMMIALKHERLFHKPKRMNESSSCALANQLCSALAWVCVCVCWSPTALQRIALYGHVWVRHWGGLSTLYCICEAGGRLISATHHPSAVVSDANACTQTSRDGVVLYIIRLFNRPESYQCKINPAQSRPLAAYGAARGRVVRHRDEQTDTKEKMAI